MSVSRNLYAFRYTPFPPVTVRNANCAASSERHRRERTKERERERVKEKDELRGGDVGGSPTAVVPSTVCRSRGNSQDEVTTEEVGHTDPLDTAATTSCPSPSAARHAKSQMVLALACENDTRCGANHFEKLPLLRTCALHQAAKTIWRVVVRSSTQTALS